jgi:hypothetical protein
MNSTTALCKSGLTALDEVRTDKLRAFHRDRLAVVYVRQSTAQQVLDHQDRSLHGFNTGWSVKPKLWGGLPTVS